MYRSDETITQRLMLSLWSNWTITALCYIAVLGISYILSKGFIPLVVAFIAFLLMNYAGYLRRSSSPRCVLIIRIGMSSIFWTAVVMATINLMNSKMLFDGYIDWSKANSDIPYINSMVLFPIVALTCIWEILRGYRTTFCKKCRLQSGLTRISNVVMAIYSRESRYQVRLLLGLSLAISAVEFWYYFHYYINVNLNSPDLFFFNVMPIALLLFSLYFVRSRYINMAMMLGPLTRGDKNKANIARVIVFSGDYVLLEHTPTGRWDTPVNIALQPEDGEEMQYQIEIGFNEISGMNNAEIRYLYMNKSYDMLSNIYHYAALMPEGQEKGTLQGEWYSLEMIDTLIRSAKISTEMADEIYRIYTITMTWKTYDRTGKRLYPIRQYRPNFRLRDFKKWTVDYSDASWFDIANNNEDSKFWFTRRLWQKIIR